MKFRSSNAVVKRVVVHDIRFPTSLDLAGSDAVHSDPDYSLCYVEIKTSDNLIGYGAAFTLGRGTEVVCSAVSALSGLVENRRVDEIFANFGKFWRSLTSESQLRWIGPESGVIHLACAAIINGLWDLFAKIEGLPVWKLLNSLTPSFLVSTIDFRYCTDVLTGDEATQLLTEMEAGKEQRVREIEKTGYPAYTTASGWISYSDEKMVDLCLKYKEKGFNAFKIKIGLDLERDYQRCKIMRDHIGYDGASLMLDSNQVFDVPEAIKWVSHLKEFKPLWIEEPTSPFDAVGHATIAEALRPLGIGVASGEMMANRVMFKQFMQLNSFEYCQIDSARIGGINELLLVYLMAKKFNIKVVPHAGGVALSEMVQHLQFWDFCSVSGIKQDRFIEFVDQQHEHFIAPATVENACYTAPKTPGYSTELKAECIENFSYPNGKEWQRMFDAKLFPRPN